MKYNKMKIIYYYGKDQIIKNHFKEFIDGSYIFKEFVFETGYELKENEFNNFIDMSDNSVFVIDFTDYNEKN